MPVNMINLKGEFSIVEDPKGNAHAIDHKKYPHFISDEPDKEYEVHPIKVTRDEGEVLYDISITVKRGDLTPRAVKLN